MIKKLIKKTLIFCLGSDLAEKLFLKKRRWDPIRTLAFLFYKINIILITIIRRSKIPNLKTFETEKIQLSENFIQNVFNDLTKKNYYFLKKNNSKYLMYDFPYSYLNEVDYSWGFERKYYINFLEANFGKKIRELFGGANYRVELVELFRTPKNSKNINSRFHVDNDLPGSIKIMIYISDVDKENGPITFKHNEREIEVTGRSGTAVFFNNVEIPHLGKPTKSRERVAITFMMYPTLRKKIDYEKIKPIDALCKLNPFSKIS